MSENKKYLPKEGPLWEAYCSLYMCLKYQSLSLKDERNRQVQVTREIVNQCNQCNEKDYILEVCDYLENIHLFFPYRNVFNTELLNEKNNAITSESSDLEADKQIRFLGTYANVLKKTAGFKVLNETFEDGMEMACKRCNINL